MKLCPRCEKTRKRHYLAGCCENSGRGFETFVKLVYQSLDNSRNNMLLLFTRPLPRDGGMAEDHGPPEAGQLPRVWTRGR